MPDGSNGPTVENDIPRPGEVIMGGKATESSHLDEAAASKALGMGSTASAEEKYRALIKFPALAYTFGWLAQDIEELKLAYEQQYYHPPEAYVQAGPNQNTETADSEITSLIPIERAIYPEQITRHEAVGRLYGDLLSTFSENPDISRHALLKMLSLSVREGHLAGASVGRAMGMINRFCKSRDYLKDMRQQFPEDKQLFEHAFGFVPEGSVKVIMGGADIAFCVSYVGDRVKMSSEAVRYASGFVAMHARDTNFAGVSVVLKAEWRDTLAHERQHVRNNYLLGMRWRKFNPNLSTLAVSQRLKEGEEAQKVLGDYMNENDISGLVGAADEIIGLCAGKNPADQIKSIISNPLLYGKSYRGLGMDEELIVKFFGEENLALIKQLDEESCRRYDEVTGSCVDAFKSLLDNGYSQDQTTGYLAILDPVDWSKFTQALLKRNV